MENDSFIIYTDAGSRGNPGKAAAAAILLNDKQMLVDLNAAYLGITTNNWAEYEGLILGMRLAIKHHCKSLLVYMDSQLVVKQIQGEYKIKDNNLKLQYNIVKELMDKFDHIEFTHVLRGNNTSADKLVNIILDNNQ